ncbi:TonB-dependent receptor [Pontibacter sp. E15-1]|uniref:SusC/RagA family TonB-linked outer membrane protein n=1 Tax=Pontibacter sp. E15-1 TaxID=2919918 RepID=UPI001F502EE4|nr:TonB-dependent receptor [Pontibacter sp. E15-1]MCJ8164300.1 TonB-dependent receptor [Pontibacter sp. E15-1]
MLLLLLVLLSFGEAIAQGMTVQGRVTDEEGVALPGVTVVLKGTTVAAPTGIEGTYSIRVPNGSGTLVYSYIGFRSKEVPVNNRATINVTLVSDSKSLEEVVIIGYGQQKKATLTGAVSTIETKELVQSPVANISNSLVGRLPGLIAIQSSGEPGFDQSSLKIRGIGTLNAGAESDPLILVDGVQRTSMNQIDPNEIESISVLKDASATAVFGVRGANGVILITTKTGETGKPQINYSSNFGVQTPTQLPDLLNSYEYATLRNEASNNMGQQPYFSPEDLEKFRNGTDPYFHPDTDWFDKVLKKYSSQQQHNFNIKGGSDNVRYFVSLGYFDQNGAYDVEEVQDSYSANPRYQRYNLRSNVDIDINKNFTAAIKIGGQFADSNYPGYGSGEIFFRILGANPLSNPGIIDGKLISGVEGLQGGSPLNDIANNGYQRNFNSTLNTSVSLQHKLGFITEGLKVRGMVAYDNYYQHAIRRSKAATTYSIVKNPDDTTSPIFIQQGNDAPFSFSESYGRNRKVYGEGAIEYARSFGDHNVSALGLYMQEKYTAPGQEYNVPRGYQGLVGRLTYNFKEKYLTEFNMGYNGSENFPENKRYGFFPSFSLGWVVTEEQFIPKNDILTFLKFRGSYGEVGNDKIGGSRFLYLPSVFFPNSGGYYFGDYNTGNYQWYAGSEEGRIGNPDVTWERAKKANFGFETSFIKDRLRVNGDIFQEKRDNILWYLGTVPALVQAQLPPVNIGKVENKGYEFEVSWNDNVGEVHYWVKANYSKAKNEIQYMDEPERAFPWLQRTGHSVGQYWGLINKGFYNTEEELENAPASAFTPELKLGDIKYEDQNGDGIIDQYDEVPIGYSRLPQIIYGASFGGDFKGFEFSILFQGSDKASTYIDEMGAWAFDTDWRNATTRHLERWTPARYAAGETITYPRVELSPTQGNHNYRPSDFWLQDASYLRLKNVEVAYRFQGGILNKVGTRSLRVFANGNNLITWSKMKTYDPEAPAGRGQFYPQMKVYNAGVSLQF